MTKVLNINRALIINKKNKELSANSEFHGGEGGVNPYKWQDNDNFFFFFTKRCYYIV